MNAKEFLSQARRLDEMINAELREVERLRSLATSLSVPASGDRVVSSRPTEAPFVKPINKLIDMERDIDAKIDRLVTLKADISRAIDAVSDDTERLVLRLRYVDGYAWPKICDELGIACTSARRYHDNGLFHVNVPLDYA